MSCHFFAPGDFVGKFQDVCSLDSRRPKDLLELLLLPHEDLIACQLVVAASDSSLPLWPNYGPILKFP